MWITWTNKKYTPIWELFTMIKWHSNNALNLFTSCFILNTWHILWRSRQIHFIQICHTVTKKRKYSKINGMDKNKIHTLVENFVKCHLRLIQIVYNTFFKYTLYITYTLFIVINELMYYICAFVFIHNTFNSCVTIHIHT